MQFEATTIYPVVRLGEEEPPSSFVFSPPADAKLVESFPDTMMHSPPQEQASDFMGKKVPEIQLRASDGKLTSLSAFRGKPVFIEFWAIWCGPCVELMPELKQLYAETAKSVVWLSIDSDEDPRAATTYLSQEPSRGRTTTMAMALSAKRLAERGFRLGSWSTEKARWRSTKWDYDISELRSVRFAS